MEQTGMGDLLHQIRTLVSEGNSMATRLEEYKYIITARDREIEMLQKMLDDANEMISSLDHKLIEMKHMQNYLAEMKQMTDKAAYTLEGTGAKQEYIVNATYETQKLKEKNTALSFQLADLQMRLEGMNQQQAAHNHKNRSISELQSMLSKAMEERDYFKNLSSE